MATIGIDLGTTYCCVAATINGQIEIVPAANGENTTPSYVAFDEDGDVSVGDSARAAGMSYPQRTIYDIKRMMGQSLSDPLIQEYSKLWPFHLTEENNRVRVRIDWNQYSPEILSGEILKHLKEQAELFLNDSVKKAVVSVPAYFKEEQKELTRKACAEAGLEVLQLLPEPAAAAIAYHHTNLERMRGSGKQNCVIFDFGGGTLDVAVITYEGDEIFIRKIGGDPNLGGEDIDTKLMEYCLNEFKAKHGIDLLAVETWPAKDLGKRAKVLRRLKLECQTQKAYLSGARRVVVGIDAIYGTTELAVPVTREKFEDVNDEIFQKCVHTTKSVLEDSGLGVSEIHQVILVGGSSRIPKIQQLLEKLFRCKLTKSINADEAIAWGAAVQANSIASDEKVVVIKEPYRMNSHINANQKIKDLENLNRKLLSKVATLERQNLKLTEEMQRLKLKVNPLKESSKERKSLNVNLDGKSTLFSEFTQVLQSIKSNGSDPVNPLTNTAKEKDRVNVNLERREYKSRKFPPYVHTKERTEESQVSAGYDIGTYLDSQHLLCGTFDITSRTVKTLLAGRFLLDQKLQRLVKKISGIQDSIDVFDVIEKSSPQNWLDSLMVGTMMTAYFTAIKLKLEKNGRAINRVFFTVLCDLSNGIKNPIQQAGNKVFTNFHGIDYQLATVSGFESRFHHFAALQFFEGEGLFVVKNSNRRLEITLLHSYSDGFHHEGTVRYCSYSFNGKGDLVCSSSEVKTAFEDNISKLYGKNGLFMFRKKNTAPKFELPVYVLGDMIAHFICMDDMHILPFCAVSTLSNPAFFNAVFPRESLQKIVKNSVPLI